MKQCAIIISSSIAEIEEELNGKLDQLQRQKHKILDIKITESKTGWTVFILYKEKKEKKEKFNPLYPYDGCTN